jgi:hypothetical protein
MNWSNIVKLSPATNDNNTCTQPLKKIKSQQSINENEIIDYDTLFNLYHNSTVEDLLFDFKDEMEKKCFPILNKKNKCQYNDFYQIILENTTVDFKYLNDTSDIEEDDDFVVD